MARAVDRQPVRSRLDLNNQSKVFAEDVSSSVKKVIEEHLARTERRTPTETDVSVAANQLVRQNVELTPSSVRAHLLRQE